MKRIIERIKGFDVNRMLKMIKVIQERSNRSALWIFLDIFRCWIKFGSGYMDYYLFYFETLSDDLKATYINVAVNKEYVRTCNDPKFYHVFHDKVEFLEKYKEFIQRDFIDLNKCTYDEFVAFCNKHNEFMAKPIDGLCGKGIELIVVKDYDLKALFDQLKANGQFLLEERIVQNRMVSSIYDKAINTIRIVTLNKRGNVYVLFRAMRIGNSGKVVDNFNNGGMFTVIDEDGIIRKPALDKDNNVYYCHPMTKTNLIGFKVPHFNQIIELCKKMTLVTPEVGLVGWDIAVTDKGLDVVEGNEIPGYDIYQSKDHLDESRKGIKERFDKAIFPERIGKKYFGRNNWLVQLIWVIFIGIVIDNINFFIGINSLFTIYMIVAYLVLNRKIEDRPIHKTIIYSCLIGLSFFICEYVFYTALVSEVTGNDLTFFIRSDLVSIIFLALVLVLKAIALNLFNLYFGFPLIFKGMEKINNTVGKILTVIFVILIMLYVSLMISPIFYIMMYGV